MTKWFLFFFKKKIFEVVTFSWVNTERKSVCAFYSHPRYWAGAKSTMEKINNDHLTSIHLIVVVFLLGAGQGRARQGAEEERERREDSGMF